MIKGSYLLRNLILAIGSIAIAISLGCGGGGGGGPTAPPTPQPANMAGTWSGTATVVSTSGGGCVANLFTPGAFEQLTISLAQGGTSLTGTLTWFNRQNSGITLVCNLNGSIEGSNFSLVGSNCNSVDLIAGCGNGPRIQLLSGSINGTVTGNTLSATGVERWQVTGSPQLTVNYRLDMQRQ